MKANRPVFLNLFELKFPVMAVVSILHRISGMVLFLALPLFLWLLRQSMISQATFEELLQDLHSPWLRLLIWVGVAAAAYHFIAGVRHLLMDLGFGEGLVAARRTAVAVFVLTALLIVLAGVWLW